MKPTFFPTPHAFRSWLARRHASAAELLVGFRKRTTERPGISWPEAVDEALRFGWIDGVRRRTDAATYTVRFSPRRPGSVWSAANIRRVADLEAGGSMTPAGREAFARRSAKKSRIYSYERREPAVLPADLERTLRRDGRAWASFQARVPSYRRKALHWVVSARGAETRLRRLRRVMASLSVEGSGRTERKS